MKKVFSLFLILTMLGCFFGCSAKSTASITVKAEDIEERLLYNGLTNKINQAYLKSAFSDSEFEEQYQKVVLPEDREAAEKELTRDLKICSLCEREGILVSRQQAAKIAQTEYQNLKSQENQKNYYQAVLKILAEQEMTEEAYLELICDQAYYQYNRSTLRSYFAKEQYDESKDQSLDEQLDDYLNDSFRSFIYVRLKTAAVGAIRSLFH